MAGDGMTASTVKIMLRYFRICSRRFDSIGLAFLTTYVSKTPRARRTIGCQRNQAGISIYVLSV